MMVASGPRAEVAEVTVGDHLERVADVDELLATTDEAPGRTIGQFLPDRPVTGLDIGCGTGRYSRVLRGLLPDGSLLAASDVLAMSISFGPTFSFDSAPPGSGRVA